MSRVWFNRAQVKHRLVERMLQSAYEQVGTRIDLDGHLPSRQPFGKTPLYLYQQWDIRLGRNLDDFVSSSLA
jgi:hypothetical protein